MEDYPSASRTTRHTETKEETGPEKNIKKVVENGVTRRKKPLGRRIKDMFIGSEDARGIGTYLLNDVAVPALKDTISDLVTQGIERALFGEARSGSSRRRGGVGGHVSYNSISRSSRRAEEPRRRDISPRGRATHDFDEIVLETRAEGMEVLEGMFDLLSQFGVVSVADMYELLGESSNFIDRKWGWEELQGSQVVKVRGGYLLDLPRTISID